MLLCHVQANARKVSKRLRGKPRHPAQLAADVLERVVVTGGERYLSAHHHLSWWQLNLLDVKAFLGGVALLAVGLVILCCYGVAKLISAAWRQLQRTRGRSNGVKGKTA